VTDPQSANNWRSLLALYRSFYRFARGMHRHLWWIFAFIVGIAVTNTLLLWQISAPLNLMQQGQFDALPTTLLILAGIVIANQATHFGAVSIAAWIEGRLSGRLRRALMARCLKASFPVVDQFPRGDILARLSNEVERIAFFLTFAFFIFVSHVLIFAFYAAMLFWIDWQLAAISLACSPAFALHQFFFGKRKEQVSGNMFRNYATLMSLENEVLASLKGTSSFRAERLVQGKHRIAFEGYRQWLVKNKWLDAWIDASVTALIYLGALVIIFFGVAHVQSGSLNIGELVSFLFFLGYLSVPIRGFSSFAIHAREVAPLARRSKELLELTALVRNAANGPLLPRVTGKIVFRDVSFSFDARKWIFEHVSFTISAGSTVALVGPSGAGKTTLVKLLMRFHDPNAGTILLDDTDIRTVRLDSLRAAIGVVWQDPFLLNDTVRSNLLLARGTANDKEIKTACEAAHAWEFIQSLPQQLDTLLGAGGVELSAGQKQRMSLAQAFLKNAPILILDEASSALDSNTEQLIGEALDRLRHNRTTLVIAHRFSAIRSADNVVFCNGDGSISFGSHDSLWNSHENYRKAVEWQTSLHHEKHEH